MDRNPKRARKKEARDLRVAAEQAAWRRRRLARIAAVVGVIAVVASLMLYATAGGDDDGETRPGAQESPASEETPDARETPTDVPCPAADAPASKAKQYQGTPYSPIEDGVDYSAVIRTTCGDIRLDLEEEQAPETVANFVFLANEGYFDGLPWHRVVGGFVIQSGDPNGKGSQEPNGPGYTIPDELEGIKDRDYRYGTLAMANTGRPDTGGSQFFIVVHDRTNQEPAGLDPIYTIFGQVAESSYDVIDDIARQPVKGGNDPATAEEPRVPVYIETIDIRKK